MPAQDTGRASGLQRQVWLQQQLAPDSAIYHIVASVRLDGELDIATLERALHTLERSQRVLRTGFEFSGGDVLAFTAEARCRPLEVRHVPAGAPVPAVIRAAALDFGGAPLDIGAGSPWRYTLLRVSAERHVLLLVFHNITVDGLSVHLLVDLLARLYTEGTRAGPVADRTVLAARPSRPSVSWREMFRGFPGATVLPGMTSEAGEDDFRGWAREVRYPAVTAGRLRELAARTRATPQAIVLSCVVRQVALSAGTADVVLGVPVSDRGSGGIRPDALGVFAGDVPVRFTLRRPGSPVESLLDVRQRMIEVLSRRSADPEAIWRDLRAVEPGFVGRAFDISFGWWSPGPIARFAALESRWELEFGGHAEPALVVQLGTPEGELRGRLRGRCGRRGSFDADAFAAGVGDRLGELLSRRDGSADGEPGRRR
ncbi:condensation domain-containing protein [Amycolatopsis sp. NPDC049159]|uniref:condensation domain-containing protein n=1 Tax=Amycolatopsis sp. NPDC049159 TaxID=3157210 RepID=UPI00340EC3CD